MRSPEALSIPINSGPAYAKDGTFTYVSRVTNKSEKKPTNGTAIHEAQHAVTAIVGGTSVIEATIVPSGDSLGSTHLSRFDAAAAMAPHAHGGHGTGWDVFVVRSAGVNPDSAASAARSIIGRHTHSVDAVAVELEERRIIDGNTIVRVMDEAEKNKRLGPEQEVTIFVKPPGGVEQRATKRTREKAVVVDLVDFKRDRDTKIDEDLPLVT